MNTKFNCPHCNGAIEADSSNAGKAGDCPACGQLLIIPAYKPLARRPPSQPTSTPAQEPKTLEDYAADAICGTAKGAWKAAKVGVPIAARIAGKVAGRAGKAVADSPVGKAWKEAPPATPAQEAQGCLVLILRLLGLW